MPAVSVAGPSRHLCSCSGWARNLPITRYTCWAGFLLRAGVGPGGAGQLWRRAAERGPAGSAGWPARGAQGGRRGRQAGGAAGAGRRAGGAGGLGAEAGAGAAVQPPKAQNATNWVHAAQAGATSRQKSTPDAPAWRRCTQNEKFGARVLTAGGGSGLDGHGTRPNWRLEPVSRTSTALPTAKSPQYAAGGCH
jgi:hypothetical protein